MTQGAAAHRGEIEEGVDHGTEFDAPLLTEPGTSGCLSVESPEGPVRFIFMSQEAFVQMRHLDALPKPSADRSNGSSSGSIWGQPHLTR